MATDMTRRVPLTALVRPKFHAGQLLTADALSDLTEWSRLRFDLGRRGLGYGIVDGLSVTSRSATGLELEIGAGYAIDRLGRDIVTPTVQTLNLADDELFHDGLLNGAEAQRRIQVEIAIEYTARDAEPRPLAYLTDNRKTRDCVYTRTDEGFRLSASIVEPTAARHHNGRGKADRFKETLDILNRYEEQFGEEDPVSTDPLLSFLNQHYTDGGIKRFPRVERKLADWRQQAQVRKSDILETLFWIVLDNRLGLESDGVEASADTEARIRLATVNLKTAVNGSGVPGLYIEDIDTAPPARTLLNAGHAPRPDGLYSLSDLLWQPVNRADAALRDKGFVTQGYRRITAAGFGSIDELKTVLDHPPAAGAWTRPRTYLLRDADGSDRVVGFSSRDFQGLSALNVSRDPVGPVAPGEEVALWYTIENTGRTDLTVDVSDTVFGSDPQSVAADVQLEAGAQERFCKLYTVTEDTSGQGSPEAQQDGKLAVVSTVRARATEVGADSAQVEAVDQAFLTVNLPLSLEIDLETDIVGGAGTSDGARQVIYRVTVKNTSAQALNLRIRLVDDLNEQLFESLVLPPGAEELLTHLSPPIPADDRNLKSRVVASASTDDGRALTVSADQWTAWSALAEGPRTFWDLLVTIWRFFFPKKLR